MCLKAFCDEAIKKFPPKVEEGQIISTYCNFAVDYIAHRMEYSSFHDKSGPFLADVICQILVMDWLRIEPDAAFSLARAGVLCVAGLSGSEMGAIRGHVAAVYPAWEKIYSPSWKKSVPVLANVGRKNGALPASRCFPIEPYYYMFPTGHSIKNA